MKAFILFSFQKISLSLLFLLNLSPGFANDSTTAYSHNSWSAGLRFNNPSGITIKKDLGSKALEMTLGRSNPWSYNVYHIFRHDKSLKQFHYSGYEPIYHPWSLQVHYLIQNPSKTFIGLQSYYGVGPHVNSFAFNYRYYYESGGAIIYENKSIYRVTAGADALAGLEYTFKRIPVSLFADITAYMEVIGYPLYTRIRTGWGFRVNL